MTATGTQNYRANIDGTLYGNKNAESEQEALAFFALMYDAMNCDGTYLTPNGETLTAVLA